MAQQTLFSLQRYIPLCRRMRRLSLNFYFVGVASVSLMNISCSQATTNFARSFEASLLTSDASLLNGKSFRMRDVLIQSSRLVKFEDQFFRICFLVVGVEVCQVEYLDAVQINLEMLNCSCSSLAARYLVMFATRYLQSASSSRRFKIVYLEDRMGIFSPEMQPALFYALDDISGGRNLGSLDPAKYSVNFGTVAPRWEGMFTGNSGTKFLRLVPSESPQYYMYPNQAIPSMQDITIMIWFKKEVPNSGIGPLLETTNAATTDIIWYLWNWSTYNYLECYMGSSSPNYLQLNNRMDLNSWNHLTLRVGGTSVDMLLNGTSLATATFNPTNAKVGDRLNIGRRVYTGGWGLNGYVFAGNVAHVGIFLRKLSDLEIAAYADLIKHSDF